MCVLTIQTSKDKKQEIKSMVVNMLRNLSYIYSSHDGNIKCVNSTIKFISFESIHYAINMSVVSSIMVLRDFDFMFLSMYC